MMVPETMNEEACLPPVEKSAARFYFAAGVQTYPQPLSVSSSQDTYNMTSRKDHDYSLLPPSGP